MLKESKRSQNIPHTTYRDLSEKKEVKDLVWKEIVKANESTSSLEIRKFRMIPKELDHEDEKTKLMCLSGVKQYPMRVKCATLSWHTMVSAFDEKTEEVKTEN